ncbi:MAG: hypothetical protein LBP32_06870, partial [Spirochaetaceae bacterium]|nr:hypothetical protein [Spirochaetaceae bacterium]
MIHQAFFRVILAAGVLAACAGTTPQPPASPVVEAASAVMVEEPAELIPDLRFVPEGFPAAAVPPGVGSVAEDAGLDDESRRFLEDSFRSAYLETLFLGLPLMGVLGEDRVHPWPAEDPVCWVQNWRSGLDYPNSWGLPRLVLALENPASRRVFAVYGPILDAYGKSAGVNGANGASGYGCPRGTVFLSGGGLVQRFDLGSFRVDGAGAVSFLPGELPLSPPPGMVGSFADGNQA